MDYMKYLLLLVLIGCSNSNQPITTPEPQIDINQVDLLTSSNILITPIVSNVYTSAINSGSLALNYSIQNIGSTMGKLKISIPYLKNMTLNQTNTSCSSTTYQALKVGQSCTVSLNYNTVNSPVGIIPYNINILDITNGNIKSEQGILNITTTIATPPSTNGCKTNYHLENRKCILNTQSCSSTDLTTLKATAGTKVFNPTTLLYGSCSPTQCMSTYNLLNNACISTLSQACSPQPANSTLGTRTSTDNGSTWSACTGFVCNTLFHLNAGSCISDTQACTITNGTGSQTWNGSAWGICTVQSCNTNYNIYNNTCVATQTRTCNPQPTNSTGGTQTSLDAGTTWSLCSGYSCQASSHNVSGTCVSNTQACTITNGTGSQTWNGTTWGTCTVASCYGGYTSYNNTCILIQTRTCNPQPTNSIGGNQTSYDGGLSWGACSGYSCNANYTSYGGSCISILTRACSPAPANTSTNGTQTSYNGGLSYGACSGYVCATSYTDLGNSNCALTNQTTVCSSQPAGSTGGTQSTTNGGATWSGCSGFTCASNYVPVGSSCLLMEQASNTSNSTTFSDNIVSPIVIGSTMYFSAADTLGYSCLFSSGGTIATTTKKGCATNSINELYYYNGSIYAASDSILYLTDTASGALTTYLNFWPQEGYFHNLVGMGGYMYYNSSTPTSTCASGYTFSRTTAGFYSGHVDTIYPTGQSLYCTSAVPSQVVSYGGSLFGTYNFSGADIYTMRFDGVSYSDVPSLLVGTSKYTEVPSGRIIHNNAVYYIGWSSLAKRKLLKTTGGSAVQAVEMNGASNNDFPAFAGSNQNSLFSFNGSLFYWGYDSSFRIKLFKWDGFTVTKITNLVTNGNDSVGYNTLATNATYGSTVTNYASFAAVGSDLYFTANSNLYVYQNNTVSLVKSGLPAKFWMVSMNGKLYITLTSSTGAVKLFRF
jgi:hypothetical protein